MAQRKKRPSALTVLADAYLLLLMTLMVFAFSGKGYVSLQNDKWSVFLPLVGGYVALSILIWAEETIIGLRAPSELMEAMRSASWVHRLMAAYLVWTLLSALLSPYGAAVWLGATRNEGVLTIALYVFSFFLLSRFGRPKPWMLWVLGVTVTLQSVICLLQLRGGNPLGLYPEGVNYFDAGKLYSGAFLGTVGNVDFLGSYYCIVVPILLASLLRLRSPLRFALLLPLALSALVIVRMQVLSCIVGLGAGCVLALPVMLPIGAKAKTRAALAILGAGALGLLLLFAVDLGGPAGTIHRILHGDVPRSVDSGRLYIWREVLERAAKRPLFGYGPDTLSMAGIEPFRRYDPEQQKTLLGYIDAAHNEYLNIFFHQGIPALAAYLGALVAAAAAWWKRSTENGVAAILGAAALCYSVQAFFNISVFFVASLFWAVLALLVGWEHQEKERK